VGTSDTSGVNNGRILAEKEANAEGIVSSRHQRARGPPKGCESNDTNYVGGEQKIKRASEINYEARHRVTGTSLDSEKPEKLLIGGVGNEPLRGGSFF